MMYLIEEIIEPHAVASEIIEISTHNILQEGYQSPNHEPGCLCPTGGQHIHINQTCDGIHGCPLGCNLHESYGFFDMVLGNDLVQFHLG